jgi:hypothetical protein
MTNSRARLSTVVAVESDSEWTEQQRERPDLRRSGASVAKQSVPSDLSSETLAPPPHMRAKHAKKTLITAFLPHYTRV